MAGPKKTTMTMEQLVAANDDYYRKLTERDDIITKLQEELRANAAAMEVATTNNTNLQKEVKQYTKDLKEKADLMQYAQDASKKSRTGQSDAFKQLEKDHKDIKSCFEDSQAEVDKLRNELRKRVNAHNKMQQKLDGANVEHEALVAQLRESQAKEQAFQESKELVDSICREFESTFTEMGRDLNPATILNHIHELQTAASKPRRKVDRKISIADELVDHSDIDSVAESEQGDDRASQSPLLQPAAKNTSNGDDYDPTMDLTAEELAEAEAQIDAEAAAEAIINPPAPQTTSNRAKVEEIMAHYQAQDDASPPHSPPVPTFDFQKELTAALERCKESEAALVKQTDRVAELEKAESDRIDATIEEARTAAANQTRAAESGAADKKRVADQDAADKSAADAEKLRLTQEVARLTALAKRLQDRLDETPAFRAHNTSLREKAGENAAMHTASLKSKDAEHSRSMKAKDAQVAEWQAAINEAQSNSLLIGPLELNPVYVDVVREKTTLEWLRDAPFWWQFLLAMMFLFLCMGNLSAWMERHAWVTANTFAMNHVRAVANQGIRGPSAATLWFEDLIGFDRTYLG